MAIDIEQQVDTRPAEAHPMEVRRGRRGPGPLWGIGGLVVAVLLLGLGALMTSNADFAEGNVRRQLAEQRITFKAAGTLTPEERARPCLVRYAGQPLLTGAQAECYANHFVGVHLKSVADGRTYSELRGAQTSLRARVAEAQAAKDPALADLQRQLDDVNAKRQTLFEGESVRGLLLTSYGFATLGAKAAQAATVAYAAGGVVLLLSLAALVWGRGRRPA